MQLIQTRLVPIRTAAALLIGTATALFTQPIAAQEQALDSTSTADVVHHPVISNDTFEGKTDPAPIQQSPDDTAELDPAELSKEERLLGESPSPAQPEESFSADPAPATPSKGEYVEPSANTPKSDSVVEDVPYKAPSKEDDFLVADPVENSRPGGSGRDSNVNFGGARPGDSPNAVGGELAQLTDDLNVLLATALQESSQLDIARANVQQAEAQLRDAEQSLVKQIVTLHAKRKQLQVKLDAEQIAMRGQDETAVALMILESNRAEIVQAITECEAELRYLAGLGVKEPRPVKKVEPVAFGQTYESAATPQKKAPLQFGPRPPIAPDMEPSLEQPVSIEFDETPLKDVMPFLAESYSLNVITAPEVALIPVTISLDNIALKNTLGAISDATRKDGTYVVFILRDGRVLATSNSDAETVYGASIPDDVPLLLRQGPTQNSADPVPSMR